jgi:PPOX class probable F420-dependent enzyme
MRLPPLTDEELTHFLREGRWVAKLATHNRDGSIRMTPLTYAADDGEIVFSTWQNSDAVRNLGRDGRASVLIDRADRPYAGVHYTGRAEVARDALTPDEYGQLFGRYAGDPDRAAASYRELTSAGLGGRAVIRFHPETVITWDFGKLTGA